MSFTYDPSDGNPNHLAHVRCLLRPSDDFLSAGVYLDRLPGPTIMVEAWQGGPQGHGHKIALQPAAARQFAAHLLNLADEVDGISPLVFDVTATHE